MPLGLASGRCGDRGREVNVLVEGFGRAEEARESTKCGKMIAERPEESSKVQAAVAQGEFKRFGRLDSELTKSSVRNQSHHSTNHRATHY